MLFQVTLARPADAVAELGGHFPLPEGFQDWGSDILRIERFHAAGEPVEHGEVGFEVYVPSGVFSVLRVEDGDWVDMVKEKEATVTASPLINEPGWWFVQIANVSNTHACGALDLAIGMDFDESRAADCCWAHDSVRFGGSQEILGSAERVSGTSSPTCSWHGVMRFFSPSSSSSFRH